MECPICFDYIKTSCIGSCTHHFCFNCLYKWCLTSNKCPICKTYINQILFDREFDDINNDIMSLKNVSYREDNKINYINYNKSKNFLSIIISFNDNTNKKFNLTLKNNNGPGVIVYKIDPECRAYHYGLRKNDIILFINNISSYNHKQSIDIFDNCQLSSSIINCKIIRK